MRSLLKRKPDSLPTREQALPGRAVKMKVQAKHAVLGTPLSPPFPPAVRQAMFGMGCFWGAERMFWTIKGVYTTAVGYAAGHTPNPTYEEVCTGMTAHNEVVLVVYDPAAVSYESLLRTFWEGHDPTQGMRQGADVGTQYRSGIYFFSAEQRQAAEASRARYQGALSRGGVRANITTEILATPEFFYAEEFHQQYLHKNPNGYCGLGGTGIACPAPPPKSLVTDSI